VHTKDGIKHIEDIQIGDLVWAYNEETGETNLQKVVNTFINESDHILSIFTKGEIIKTTAEHPLFTQDGWKDAADLQSGDKILTANSEHIEVLKTEFSYDTTTVYNFEVDNWHTYYVGAEKLLVHNAPCATKALKEVAENIAKTWDDLAKFKHCFTEGTLVKTENGYTPIETLQKGYIVACYDFENSEVVYSEVTEVYCNTAESYLIIYIDDEVIECTQHHQFWSVDNEDWVIAKDLNEGDWLLSANGDRVQIIRIQLLKQQSNTYNLEIENHHNYFVSSLDILVHNGNPFPNSVYNDLATKSTKIYGIVDKKTKQVVYVGKSIQKEGTRLSQHVLEKGLDPKRYSIKVLEKGKWNAFQTAAREQYHISKNGTKVLKKGAEIKNKINALSKRKFNYFSKLIKCP